MADRRDGDVRGKSDDAPGTRAGGRFQSDRRRGRARTPVPAIRPGQRRSRCVAVGPGAYAYGAYFHRFLADRYGTESLNELADASSGRVPFFGAPAFTQVFGRSIGTLWNDYRTARQERAVPDERDGWCRPAVDARGLQPGGTPVWKRRHRLLCDQRSASVSSPEEAAA